jgi:flagellin
MQLSINSSYTSTTSLSSVLAAYQKAMLTMSIGQKINSAASNPAALVTLQSMQSQIDGLNQSDTNTQNAVGLLNTAQGAMADSTSELQQMQSLAVEAANGTMSDSDRGAIQQEMNQLAAQVNDNANNTQFNGINTNNGTLTDFVIQTGANSGQETVTSIPNVSMAALGVNDNVSTQTAAEASLGTIKTGIQELSVIQGTVGATTNDLEYNSQNALQSAGNTQSAASTIGDTNVAEASTQFTQSGIQQYVAIMMQAQQMQQSQGILSLLA